MAFKMYKRFHKPKKDKLHTALYNIAAVAGISAVFFQQRTLMVGTTVIATVYHVIILVIDDDFL